MKIIIYFIKVYEIMSVIIDSIMKIIIYFIKVYEIMSVFYNSFQSLKMAYATWAASLEIIVYYCVLFIIKIWKNANILNTIVKYVKYVLK